MKNEIAEQTLLSILSDRPDALIDRLDRIKDTYFGTPNHLLIWKAIKKAYIDSVPFNQATIQELLPPQCDTSFLFPQQFEPDSNLDLYIGILRTNYLRRELIALHKKQLRQIEDPTQDPSALISQTEDVLVKLSQAELEVEPTNFGHVMMKSIAFIKQNSEVKSTGKIIGSSFGVSELDSITGGARKKELTIIGGRPGMGKTLLTLRMNVVNSIIEKRRGLNLSLEMSHEVNGERLIAQELDVDLTNIHTGFVTKLELGRIFAPIQCKDCGSSDIDQQITIKEFKVDNICKSCGSFNVENKWQRMVEQESPFDIDDRSGLSLAQIVSKIKSHKIRFPDLEYVIVDYLNLIGHIPGDSKNEKYGLACTTLRNLAKTLNIAIILVVQLSRQVEAEPDKRPKLWHLRDSGEIEQTADLVILVFRQGYYDPNADQTKLELIIAKQKHGPTRTIVTSTDLKLQKIFSEERK